ncbi:MAG: sensor histidine kinase [Acidobacteriota bacterium]
MPISVLLVDDEPLYAALLAQRLSGRDFAVTVAADGDEALRAAASSPPDLVLLDVNLPGKSGVEVLAELKRAGFAGEALMLTGQAGVETAVAGMKLGAADYLSKSLEFDELVAALNRAYGRKLRRAESARLIEVERLAALGRVAEGAAHEINNPVTVMTTMAGWIEDLCDDLPESAGETTAEIRQSARQIAAQGIRIKAVMLDLLKCGGRFDPRPATLCPHEAAAAVLADRAGRIRDLGVSCVNAVPPDLEVRFPPGAFELVCSVLVDNALDAVTERGGFVEIAARVKAGEFLLSVADDGPGIAEAVAPRIFEPFFSTRESKAHSGLGLAAARGVARGLGGDIDFALRPGGGCLFTARFPVP